MKNSCTNCANNTTCKYYPRINKDNDVARKVITFEATAKVCREYK